MLTASLRKAPCSAHVDQPARRLHHCTKTPPIGNNTAPICKVADKTSTLIFHGTLLIQTCTSVHIPVVQQPLSFSDDYAVATGKLPSFPCPLCRPITAPRCHLKAATQVQSGTVTTGSKAAARGEASWSATPPCRGCAGLSLHQDATCRQQHTFSLKQ